MTLTSFLRVALIVLVAAGSVGLVLSAWSVPVPPMPRLGYRGVQRRRALEAGGGFALLEPLMRFVAGLLSSIPLPSLRAARERDLLHADHPLGLTTDELNGLAILAALGLGGVTLGIASWVDLDPSLGLAGALLGLILPSLQLREVAKARAKEIARGLPHAIEIIAMCMGAGHDFPGAVRLVAEPHGQSQSALSRELKVILEHLELGHTRRQALLSFAERVPSEAVRDFVNAVVQAEQKGNPLAKVLQVQGRMLSMRRSVAAEEAAARAAVMLVAPTMILVCCVLLLLMGPFLVKGAGF